MSKLTAKLSRENLPKGWTESNLPKGWIKLKLNEISVINPRKPEVGLIDDGLKVSFIPMKCVGELTGKVDLSTTRAYAEVKKNYTYFINNDIIFAKITPCMENGKVAIVRELKNGIGFGSTEFHVIRLKDTLNQKFYFYYLMQDDFRDGAQNNMKGTAGQLRVPADYLKNALVPMPPINEQKRIVTKIESIFAKIDKAETLLKDVHARNKQLRQVVLKRAFEGKLVPQDPNDEPVPSLSKRINPSMRQFNDLKSDRGLPKGWALAAVGKIASLINGRAFKPEDWSNEGLPIVRIQNLNDHNKSFNYCNFQTDEKFLINSGQLLFAWSGTPGTSFGCFIWNRGKAVLNQHIFRVEVDEKQLNKHFMCYAINQNLDKYINKAHGGVGLRHITKSKFEEEEIPLPPLNEQKRIVAKIESVFARIDAIDEHITKLLSVLAMLRKSVLKHAFEGRLVPQDPNDEPAYKLLEQVRGARHA